MHFSSRLVSVVLLIAASALAHSQATPSNPSSPTDSAIAAFLPPLTIHPLHPNFYVIDGTSNGQDDVPNLVVYVTPAGVLLVDPWFAKDYDRVVAAVRSVTDLPIRWVVNTHYHSDHTGANGKFPAAVEIAAHANTRRHMLEQNMPGPPTVTFSDEQSIFLGGREIQLRYLGRGHTDGDIAVYFTEWKTVCLGDMMAGTRGVTNPVVDYASGGKLAAWPSSLDRALALDLDAVIPGHGPITDRAGLLAHREKVQAVGDRLRQWDSEGKTKEQIRALLISEFDFKPINLRALDGLIAEFKQ
jgi:cyclase